MALHYHLEDVKVDYKSDDIWPTTRALIFGTANVGLGEITEKNWKEFYIRSYIVENIHGVWRYDEDLNEIPIQPQEVKDHIGLATNASNYTKEEFMEITDKVLRERAAYHLKDLEE
jgi:hypothetical protein|tara:strand:- start:210 stop:557 length:348 start_codon:yes stop_codon:yes gene_type:complete